MFSTFGISSAAIIYPAVDSIFKKFSKSEILKNKYKYKLPDKYFLSVATWEPRKNLELLIRAFTELKQEGLLPKHELILVGGRGWKDKRLLKIVNGNPSIISLGYIPDSTLVYLYNRAESFIFPSLYEGYGMPVAEALACGTPVITSDSPELREASNFDAIYVNPDLLGIKRGIIQVANSKSKFGRSRISKSWNSSGEIMVKVIERLLT